MSLNRKIVENNFDYIRKAIRKNSQEFLIAFFLYEITGIKKEEITDDIINSVDSILEENECYYDERLHDRIVNIKTEVLNDKLRDSLNNYIDNCTDQEWNYLLNEYNISDDEDYMGEVREDMEDAIIEDFNDAEEEKQEKLLKYFSKYDSKEKELEQEEDLEK